MKVVIIGIVEKLHPLSFLIWRMLQQHLLLANVHCVIYLMTALVISGTPFYINSDLLLSLLQWRYEILICWGVIVYIYMLICDLLPDAFWHFWLFVDPGPRSLPVETSARQTNSTCYWEGLVIQFTFFLLALCLNWDGSIIISCHVASCIAIQLSFGSMLAAIGLHCTYLASSH